MSEVVYEIDISDSPKEKPRKKTPRPDRGEESDPGVAVSSSVIFSGLGQFYNGQYKLGSLFFVTLLSVLVFTIFTLAKWSVVDAWLQFRLIPHAHFALFYGILLIIAALVWSVGVVQAYMEAVSLRRGPYKGTPSRVLPALASLVVPGWGQLLNGQAKKGFLALALTTLTFLGAVTAVLIVLLWDNFQNPADRLIWEKILIISIIPLISAPLLWTACIYDALVVGLDEVKKESLWNRIKYAKNRLQMKGWKKGVLYPFLITLGFSLGLLLVGVAGYYFIERSFYISTLESTKTRLEEKNMVILPDVIARGLSVIHPADENPGPGPEAGAE